MRKALNLIFIIGLMFALTACGSSESDGKVTVRLGILKNVTHAPAIVALDQGFFQKQFGEDVIIDMFAFDNGSDFSTALATNNIDIGYAGPGPIINQYLRSENFKVIAGSNNGGATLVVRKDSGISSLSELKGKVIATPTRGSTPELSLRMLLEQEGFDITTDSSGVQMLTRSPIDVMVAMSQGEIDGALIHEPWGSQIISEGIGEVLVNWDQIPPNNGDYPLTILVASDEFLSNHRNLAKGAIEANLQGIQFIQGNQEEAYQIVADQLMEWSGTRMELELIASAFNHLRLTDEVNQEAMRMMADVSIDAGYIRGVTKESLDLSSLFDFSILQEVHEQQ